MKYMDQEKSEDRAQLTLYLPSDLLARLNQRLFDTTGSTHGRTALIVKAIQFYLDNAPEA